MDTDRDRKWNIAVWRPSNGTWYIVNPDHTSTVETEYLSV